MLSPLNSSSPRRNDSWLSVWPGVCQTSSLSLPTLIVSPSSTSASSFTGGIDRWISWAAISANVLIAIAAGQGLGGQRVADDLGLQQLVDLGQSLNVVDVGVRGDQHLAVRQREIELADQLDDLVDRLLVADVDQQPLGVVVDQVDVAAQALARLDVHFDHVGKDRLALEHGFEFLASVRIRRKGQFTRGKTIEPAGQRNAGPDKPSNCKMQATSRQVAPLGAAQRAAGGIIMHCHPKNPGERANNLSRAGRERARDTIRPFLRSAKP